MALLLVACVCLALLSVAAFAASVKKYVDQPQTSQTNHEITDLENSGQVLETTSKSLYLVAWDNTLNGVATYLKFYNDAAPTIGTTVPEIVILCPASKAGAIHFAVNQPVFATAMTVAAVTAGGTGGTTAPTSSFDVDIVTA